MHCVFLFIFYNGPMKRSAERKSFHLCHRRSRSPSGALHLHITFIMFRDVFRHIIMLHFNLQFNFFLYWIFFIYFHEFKFQNEFKFKNEFEFKKILNFFLKNRVRGLNLHAGVTQRESTWAWRFKWSDNRWTTKWATWRHLAPPPPRVFGGQEVKRSRLFLAAWMAMAKLHNSLACSFVTEHGRRADLRAAGCHYSSVHINRLSL